MYTRKNGIKSVEVDWRSLYKARTPQYNVKVTYEDGSVTNKIMYEKEIRIYYAKYLPKKADTQVELKAEAAPKQDAVESQPPASPRM
jgi:hypothetical protein